MTTNHTDPIPDGDQVPQPPRDLPAPLVTWTPATIFTAASFGVLVLAFFGAGLALELRGDGPLVSVLLAVSLGAGTVGAVSALIAVSEVKR